MSPVLSVDDGFVDAVPAVVTLVVLVFVVVNVVVLENGLLDDVEVAIGD